MKFKKTNLILVIGIIILIIVGLNNLMNVKKNNLVNDDPKNNNLIDENINNIDNIILVYCPTMEGYAKELSLKNPNIKLMVVASAAQALSFLNSGRADLALVGRITEKSELDNAFEIRLRNGLTLVGKQKKMVHESELKNIKIHTYISEEEVRKYLSETANIIYHDSFELAIKEGFNDIILIDWHDYSDNLGLVIPIDIYGNKVEKFRIPVLYSYDNKIFDNLDV